MIRRHVAVGIFLFLLKTKKPRLISRFQYAKEIYAATFDIVLMHLAQSLFFSPSIFFGCKFTLNFLFVAIFE
jgi:hypothetical protein